MNRKDLSLNFMGKIKFYQQASYHLLPTTYIIEGSLLFLETPHQPDSSLSQSGLLGQINQPKDPAEPNPGGSSGYDTQKNM